MKEVKNTNSVRDFVDAADVRGIYLYRKDGVICTYLRIFNFNLELLKKEECQGKTDALSAGYKDDRKDFDYLSLPREVDLDKYKQTLASKHSQAMQIGKRHLLGIMMKQCARLSMSNENYEHQHFVKIWKPANKKNYKSVEDELGERIRNFEAKYKAVGINCEVLSESEIIKLCNMFGNNIQTGYDSNDLLYDPIPFLKSN